MVSTDENFSNSMKRFKAAGIDSVRLHLDWQAIDTATNFTTTVGQIRANNIEHIYLPTSDFHMRRARAIALLVLGSRSIAYTPVKVSSNKSEESAIKVIRDIGRSMLWLVTGRTGAKAGVITRASSNRIIK